MTSYKTKSFNFFRGRFNIEPFPFTLEELLSYSMEGTRPIDRMAPLDKKENIEESEYYGFIGYKGFHEGFWCAGFFSVEKDKVEHVFTESLGTEEIVFTPVPPPIDKDGNKQQYLDGKLYFICTQNDLILSADRRLSHKHLQKYLNSIISKRMDWGEDLPEGYELSLIRPPSRNLNADIKNAKQIILSVPLIWGLGEAPEPQGLEDNKYWNALKTFVGKTVDLTPFDTRGFIQKERLKMDIALVLDKKRNEDYSDNFDSIVNVLRYVDDETDYRIITDSGTWTKDDLILRKPKGVEHIDDIPVNKDIFNKMAEWYSILLRNGDI